MTTALPKWEGLHTVGTNSFGVQIDGGAAVYIGANDYYWSSTADGGTTNLLAAWATLLSATVASTTVTLDDATGIITIIWGSGSHSLTWVNETVRDRFGATGNFASAAQLVMPRQCLGLWLPNVPGGMSGSVTGLWVPESDRQVTVSRSGAHWATSNSERYKTTFEFRGLTKAKLYTADESRVNESLQTFWEDCLNYKGGIFRHHPDRAVDGTYHTAFYAGSEGWDGLARMSRRHDAIWNIDVPVRKYVHVSTGGGF